MQEITIPRYIDSQMQLFFWEFDEFILAVSLFAVGILLDSLLLTVVMIYVVNKAFRRYKDGAMQGALLHLMYWYGFMPLNSVATDALARRKYY